jgi:iron uptake system component EfeO
LISVRPLLLAVLGLAALAAGCGDDDDDDASSAQGARTVEVAITDAGCEPASLTLKAGPTTFHVTNRGTSQVNEFEVLDGEQVLAEAENLDDGDDGSFSLTLKKGEYGLKCPGGETAETGTLTVSGGGAAAELSAAETATVDRYRDYLEQNTAELQERTAEFADAVKAGDIEGAKALFATTREPYEAIEPVAESFGDLDPAIDARINDVDGGFSDWTGFHRLEWSLWKQGKLGAKEKQIADKLVADVDALAEKVKTVELEPAQIVNGSNELLGEVAKSKITGEEDRYSHTDLWDFQANLDGSREGFESAKPLLVDSDPELSKEIENRFAAAQEALDRYRKGDGWTLYTELSEADTRELSQRIDALAEPLSEAPGKLVSG